MRDMVLVVLFVATLAPNATANSGVSYTRGDTLYPIEETSIALEYERLIFQVDARSVRVNVSFEFNNPGPERTVDLGFAVPDENTFDGQVLSYVSDFVVAVNGTVIPYETHVVNYGTTPPAFRGAENGDYFFTFPVTFAPGTTRIEHSYSFPYTAENVGELWFTYRLRTGGLWAGGTIGEFEAYVFGLKNNLVSVNLDEWEVVGTGGSTRFGDDYLFVGDGYLRIHETDYRPTKDILLTEHWSGGGGWYVYDDPDLDYDRQRLLGLAMDDRGWVWPRHRLSDDALREYSADDLVFLMDAIHAWNGLVFPSSELDSYFRSEFWYTPDYSASAVPAQMIPWHQTLIDRILATPDYPNTAAIAAVEASSFLPEPYDRFAYHPARAFDHQDHSMWIERAPGAGIGETLTVVFDRPIAFDAIAIKPGCFWPEYWNQNHRVAELTIHIHDYSYTATFEDEMVRQLFELDEVTMATEVSFTIEAVYETTNWQDTAISEIEFRFRGDPVDIAIDAIRPFLDTD